MREPKMGLYRCPVCQSMGPVCGAACDHHRAQRLLKYAQMLLKNSQIKLLLDHFFTNHGGVDLVTYLWRKVYLSLNPECLVVALVSFHKWVVLILHLPRGLSQASIGHTTETMKHLWNIYTISLAKHNTKKYDLDWTPPWFLVIRFPTSILIPLMYFQYFSSYPNWLHLVSLQ